MAARRYQSSPYPSALCYPHQKQLGIPYGSLHRPSASTRRKGHALLSGPGASLLGRFWSRCVPQAPHGFLVLIRYEHKVNSSSVIGNAAETPKNATRPRRRRTESSVAAPNHQRGSPPTCPFLRASSSASAGPRERNQSALCQTGCQRHKKPMPGIRQIVAVDRPSASLIVSTAILGTL